MNDLWYSTATCNPIKVTKILNTNKCFFDRCITESSFINSMSSTLCHLRRTNAIVIKMKEHHEFKEEFKRLTFSTASSQRYSNSSCCVPTLLVIHQQTVRESDTDTAAL